MRTLAVSLLLFAAVVFALTRDQDGFLGFVNAGAEASMVGAIADWFAVTALFKHPLGLPVPHTALIPRRKDELGKGLQDFVGENFLQEDIIRERVGVGAERVDADPVGPGVAGDRELSDRDAYGEVGRLPGTEVADRVEDVEPLAHGIEVRNVFQDDVRGAALPREAALANAPRRNAEGFLVPAVLE